MTGAPLNDMSRHSRERLNVLKTTNDGFKIAEEDLKLRGPGDFFGLRQSGLPYFKIADIYEDATLLKRTRSVLEHILNDDPEALNDLKEALRQKEDLSFTDFHGICL
jgi:ATP-dependent DNA helicase RecG